MYNIVLICDCLVPGCNKKNIKSLHRHLRKHNLTLQQYLELYPNAEISNPMHNDKARKKSSLSHLGKSNSRKGISDVDFFGEERAKEIANKIGVKSKGNTHAAGKRTEEFCDNCSQRMKGKPSNRKGKNQTEEAKKKISDKCRGIPNVRKGIPNIDFYGEERAREIKQKVHDKIIGVPKNNKGARNGMFGKIGKLNSNYKCGSCLGYPDNWNNIRKQRRELDDNKCVLCRKTMEDNGKELDVHHVEYDKTKNDIYEDLKSLCRKCHAKINGKNREQFYKDLFKSEEYLC